MNENFVELCFDIVVLAVLIFASIDDIKTRIVRPVFQLIILSIAVLHTIFAFGHYGWRIGITYIATGVLMFLIYIVMLLIFKTGIGGADTKVTSSLALYLGVWPAIIMVLVHGIAGVGYAGFMEVTKKKHVKSVPLMIFLAIGFVAARGLYWALIL